MTIHCPTCGSEMLAAHAPLESLAGAPLSRTETKIVEVLAASYPAAVNAEDVVKKLPTDIGSFKVQVTRLRKKIERFGWTIPVNDGGSHRHGFYRLKPLEAR